MTTRYDIKAWRKSANGKAYTVRVGSAWTDQKGTIRLGFDALPLPDENGSVQCFLEEPRDRDAAPSPARRNDYASAKSAPGKASSLDGDSIPF